VEFSNKTATSLLDNILSKRRIVEQVLLILLKLYDIILEIYLLVVAGPIISSIIELFEVFYTLAGFLKGIMISY
jgi:hypothetical protein